VKVYVDSSVLLRLLLGQPGALREWREVDTAVASTLLRVECLRTLDRLRLCGAINEQEDAARRNSLTSSLKSFEVIDVTPAVLDRASEPLPLPLGTLDAIHLATAFLWREEESADLVLATHDAALAAAGRLYGFPVLGA
jgi:predicted nucleic acid-binding protein